MLEQRKRGRRKEQQRHVMNRPRSPFLAPLHHLGGGGGGRVRREVEPGGKAVLVLFCLFQTILFC